MAAVKHAFVSAKADGGDSTLVRPSDWNAEHEGNSVVSFIVAANDAPAKDRQVADYVCDNTADDVQIQAAIDALPSRGGTVYLAPGLYTLAAGIVITANKRIEIVGPGAAIAIPASTTGLKIEQGSTGGTIRGVYVYGVRFSGGNNSGTIGVDFTDTNWSGLFGVQIEDCDRGILMHAETTNEFVEGITLEDVVIRNSATYGIELRRTSGTNSFGQHSWRNVNINCGTGTGRIGLLVPSGCSVYRSRLEVGVWITSDQTGVSLDGDFDNTVLDLFVEGATGSTGNTALTVGTNATNLDRMEFHFSTWGTVNTTISNAFSKNFAYRSGRRYIGVTNASPIQVFQHGQSAAAVILEHGGPAGGRITFGTQSGSVQDVNIFRSAADVLATSDKFDPTSLNLQTKAGAIADGDITPSAADGDIGVNTTDNSLEYRSGGSWRRLFTQIISRGGTIFNPDGISAAVNIIVWRAPFACTVTNVRGYRVGGTGATINARRNGTSNHLASALSLTSADTWMDGGSVQNTAYAAGDKLEIMVVSATGSPTQVAVQVDFTRP